MKRIMRAVVVGLLCGLVLTGTGRSVVAAGAAPAEAARVNVNSASAEELERLPGIGPSLARAIIEQRSAEPFKTTEDLRKVKGIGDRLYDQLKDQITVGDPGTPQKGRGS
jgi:competence protein ComEA